MEERAPSDPVGTGHLSTKDGLVGGLLAGIVVLILFFILDILQGTPLRTPAFLASAVFRPMPEAIGVGHMALFTLIHLVVFSVVGGAAVWVFRLARVPENVFLGGFYGLLFYTVIFYLALSLTGMPVGSAPEWPAVLLGNFVAGVVIGGYLHWVGPRPGIVGIMDLLKKHAILREGTIAGLLGAAVVAVWFFIMDLTLRELFFTPAALGSMLFLGASGPDAVVISPATVLGYTVVHLAAFIVVGVVVAGAVIEVERHPILQYAVVMLFAILGVLFAALVTVLGVWILGELAIWSVLVGNLLAAVAVGSYLWKAHPKLIEVFREEYRGGRALTDPSHDLRSESHPADPMRQPSSE